MLFSNEFKRGDILKYSRGLLGIGISAMLCLSMVACAGSSTNEPADLSGSALSTAGTTIEIMTTWGGVDSKAGTFKEILAKFEGEDNTIKILNQSIFGDDYLPTLKTRFASGNEPDIFGLWPGSDIKFLVKANKVAELTDKLKQDREWMDSFAQNSFMYTTYDDKIYGIPFELVFEGLFINKDLFKKYRVKIPDNYEELKAAIEIFISNGIIPIAYNSSAEGSYIYQNMIASLGGRSGVVDSIKDGMINKHYLDAMKYLKELYDMGAFPKDALTLTSNQRNELFFTKQAAMIVQGSWFIPYFDKDDDSVEMIPFPAMTKGSPKVPTGLGGGTFYISKSSWDTPTGEDSTIKLLKYLTSKESAEFFYERTALLSNLRIVRGMPYSILAQQSINFYKNTSEEDLTSIPDHIIDRSAWNDIVIQQFPYFLEGKRSAEEIWSQAVEKMLRN